MAYVYTGTGLAPSDEHLAHHGILRQKWGVRRFQNYDGTLTEAGKIRYRKLEQRSKDAEDKYKKAVARTPSRAMRWNDIGIYVYDKKMRKINSLHAKSERAKAEVEKFKGSLGDEILKAKIDKGVSEAVDASATTEIRNDADEPVQKGLKDPEYLEKVKTSSGDTRYFYDKSELKAYKDGKSGATDKDLDDAFKKMRNSSKTDEEKDLKEHYWTNARDNDRWDINFLEAVQNSVILDQHDKKSLLTEYAKYLSDPMDYLENGRDKLKEL